MTSIVGILYNDTRIYIYIYIYIYICVTKARWIILRYRNISERICGKIKKGILCSLAIFLKNNYLWGTEKNVITRHGTKYNIICSCSLNDSQIRLEWKTFSYHTTFQSPHKYFYFSKVRKYDFLNNGKTSRLFLI
jgi:hypothetical protein